MIHTTPVEGVQGMSGFTICETGTGTWHYHLRKDGSVGAALCGKAVGWNTKIPLAAWGIKDHIPSKWCRTCAEKAGIVAPKP